MNDEKFSRTANGLHHLIDPERADTDTMLCGKTVTEDQCENGEGKKCPSCVVEFFSRLTGQRVMIGVRP